MGSVEVSLVSGPGVFVPGNVSTAVGLVFSVGLSVDVAFYFVDVRGGAVERERSVAVGEAMPIHAAKAVLFVVMFLDVVGVAAFVDVVAYLLLALFGCGARDGVDELGVASGLAFGVFGGFGDDVGLFRRKGAVVKLVGEVGVGVRGLCPARAFLCVGFGGLAVLAGEVFDVAVGVAVVVSVGEEA